MNAFTGAVNIQDYIYPVFNILAISLIYFYCYQQGMNDGLDRRAWAITLLIRFLFFIIGCKLFTISSGDLLSGNYDTTALLSQRTLTGGIVYGLGAFIILFLYFNLPYRVLDYAIIPMLAGLCIQKVGCFFAGCCFGEIYEGPFSVTYTTNTPVFYSQALHHLISTHDTIPLSVHPVQLYEAFGYLLAIGFILTYRKKVKVNGSLLLLTTILIFTVRLITNIFRDASSYIVLGNSPETLLGMQITLCILILILTIWFYLVEHKRKFIPLKNINFPHLPSWPWLIAGIIGIILTLTWYNGFELLFLISILIIALYEHVKVYPVIVWGRAAVVLVALVLLTSQQSAPVKKDSVLEKYNTVKFGFSTGEFVNSLTFDDSDGCDSKTRYFNQKQTMLGFGYSTNKTRLRQNKKGKNYTTQTETSYYSFMGSQSEQWADTPGHVTDFTVFGGGVQIREQLKWIGVGVGVNAGNLRFAYQNKIKNQSTISDPDQGYWSTPILPSAYFRIGPRHILFGEYTFAQNFPSPTPSLYSMFSAGTGFGLKNGAALKVGTLTGIRGTILSLNFPVGKQLGIESYYHFGNSESYNTSSAKQNQFSLSIEYKLIK